MHEIMNKPLPCEAVARQVAQGQPPVIALSSDADGVHLAGF